ncbi:HD domain-containing protein [Paucidesulfovibrio gracilis DSM 16080]|uniref:HD domain-containing protein n=1 Tax=Paucidesulfovibrio gracilis DSM 16080 TaxID=1121449 RepID=A0A1T4X1F0_9BACT|nr:HD domain-containing phosphohydrolase [Paucidesulfovibrio gracilis]SKA83473.1 HD domain-containing protein [Paucidesulfovibrio gracilis DSM 16080]
MFRDDLTCGAPLTQETITTALHEFAESLGTAVDARDHHTRKHSEEVAQVAYGLAVRMGLSTAHADVIHVAAHLHDVGKIGIPDAVLFKPGPLTPAEWAMLKRHPAIGAEIVQPVQALCRCGIREIILHHHERWDGQGYPHGLHGTEIPLGARIIAVADSLSAMMQRRPYRKAMRFCEAREEILRCAGTQFDPNVVAAFERSASMIGQLMEMLSD